MSPRGWLELVGGGALVAAAVCMGARWLTTKVALQEARTSIQAKNLVIQANDASTKSCQAAMGLVQSATDALADATDVAYATADKVLREAQDRSARVAVDIRQLKSIQAAPGQDCQTALALARAAWEEGQ